MAHTPFEQLQDLEKQLEEIRKLYGIKEKKPGIFYYKAIPFLHFHNKDGQRWADVKNTEGWLKITIGFDAKETTKQRFLKEIKKAHSTFIQK